MARSDVDMLEEFAYVWTQGVVLDLLPTSAKYVHCLFAHAYNVHMFHSHTIQCSQQSAALMGPKSICLSRMIGPEISRSCSEF